MQKTLNRRLPDADVRLPYGPDPNQFGEFWRPRDAGRTPAVIVVHGGFWRSAIDLKRMNFFCQALRADGLACFNVEYRRVGQNGGGWPGTTEDIRAAALYFCAHAAKYSVDTARIMVVGHSAGGHLALWLAGEKVVALKGALSLAGVADLRKAWELKLGNGAVEEFLGGTPTRVPDRYKQASPMDRLPLRLPARLVHGTADDIVPIEISKRFETAARASHDDVRLIPLPETGHSELIDPFSPQWPIVIATLRALLM